MDPKRPPPIELRQLHAFRVLAKELHFGRTAAKLGISQPPLSQQIKRLEQVVGHKLFDRDTRRVELTPAGSAMVEVANQTLSQLSAGLERVREIATGDAGRLSVGFTPTTALRFLPLLVSSFRQEFAGVDLGLVELHPDAMRDGLLAREIDVSLIREPTAVPGLEIVPIVEEPFVAVLPVGHKMADPSTPFSLAGLRHDPFVLFPRDEASGGLAKMLALCAEAGFTPRIVQEAPGWQTAISLVGSGLGVSILPESVVSLQLPGITYRLIASVIRSQTCLLCREDDRRPMVRNFIACGAAVMVG